ncbi:MAG: alkaline phosphatase [Sandaracinaceae bacterium]|nr:alkaline phosphatase [Sandaracinaceae bacterium]
MRICLLTRLLLVMCLLTLSGTGLQAQVHEGDARPAVASAAIVAREAADDASHANAGVDLFEAPLVPFVPPPDPLAGMHIASSPERSADFVVLISIDGLRADAVTPANHTLARLRNEGTWATDAMTIHRSTTLPSHASMVTGVDLPVHGMAWNAYRPSQGVVRFPTMFRVARMAGLATTMVVGKNKLRHLVDEGGAENFIIAGRGCDQIVSRASTVLRTGGPGIVFLHFADTDQAGHRHGWMSQPYLAAVEHADQCTERVVDTLSHRAGGLARVLLIVTSDHGGHRRSHGSASEVDRHIPWYAWGGAAARDTRVTRRVNTQDTASTILSALGLPQTPGIEGRPVVEALHESGSAALAERTTRRRGARTARAAPQH